MPTPWFVRLAGLLTWLALVAGCRSFERDWQAADAGPAGGLNGRWIGTWQNTNNTHSGRLRAVVCETGPGEVRARFHATWGRMAGSFRTRLRGRWEDGTWRFSGRRRIAGFLITTEGSATPDRMDVQYRSRPDTGTFTLRRPDAPQ